MITLAANDARRVALESDDVIVAVLLTVQFPTAQGGTLRYTDSAHDLKVGGSTYSSEGKLRSATPPPPATESARDLAEVSFWDPLEPGVTTFRTRFTAGGWTGIRMSMDVAFIAPESGSLSLPLRVYRGRCVGVESDIDDGVPYTLARFAGPLVRLDTAAALYTSDLNQRERRASDGSMRFAHVARDIEWGRKIRGDGSGGSSGGSGPPGAGNGAENNGFVGR